METKAEPTPSSGQTDSVKEYPPALSLLAQLDHLLGTTGSIKNTKDIPEFIKVMQVSQFLVSRCIVLNIIKSTKAQSTLEELMQAGGWTVLNLWLAEAKKGHNVPLLVELLKVLERLPVTVDALKQGNMGKLIKQLSKAENPEVKLSASNILAKWMAIFRGPPTPSGGKAEAPSEEHRNSSFTEDDPAKPSKPKKDKTDKKSSSTKKRDSKSSKVVVGPPVESIQPPPGPMVALGRPRDKPVKRARDPLLAKSGQPPPPEKRVKGNSDPKGIKGPKESEGFMAFLSNQVATKQKKVKKIPKLAKMNRTNSVTSDTNEARPDVTTPTTDTPTLPAPEEEEEEMEVTNSTKKKKVSWASDDNLAVMHYFELDESERVNVNHVNRSFLAAAQQEKRLEREALESGLMFSRDRLNEATAWVRPLLVDIPPDMVHSRGLNSEERDRQTEREKTVLAQLFLSKSSVQPSPMEPDPEPSIPDQEPKLIPLNEPGAPTNQPPPMYPPPPTLPLPPPHGPIEPPLLSPGTTINQAQSLINFYSSNVEGPKGPPESIPRENGQFSAPPGGFYAGGPPMRGGEAYGPGRGGFRRRFPLTGLESKICKHFLTHGCRMGTNCRFLHCTPEELADKISLDQRPPMRGFRGRGRPWGRGRGAPLLPSSGPPPNIVEQMDTSLPLPISNDNNGETEISSVNNTIVS